MQKRQGKEDKCEVNRLAQYGFKMYDAVKQTLSTHGKPCTTLHHLKRVIFRLKEYNS